MKTIRTFCIVLAMLAFINQKTMAQKKSPAVLNHIAVYVSSLTQSTQFYESVFDLKIIPEPFKDGKHTWFSLGHAGQLHLIEGEKANQQFDRNNHLCFSVADINEFIKELQSASIKFESWAGESGGITHRADGVKQIYFKDPDGHWLEVNDAK